MTLKDYYPKVEYSESKILKDTKNILKHILNQKMFSVNGSSAKECGWKCDARNLLD